MAYSNQYGVDSSHKTTHAMSSSVKEKEKESEDYSIDDEGLEPLSDPEKSPKTDFTTAKAKTAYGYTTKSYGSELATSSNIETLPVSPGPDYLKQLVKKGLSYEVAIQQFFKKYGYYPSKADYNFAKEGYSGLKGPVPYYYNTSYGSSVNQFVKSYGDTATPQDMMKFLQDQQMYQDTKDQAREMKKNQQEEKRRIHMIMLMLMIGEPDMAVRAYTVFDQKQKMEFSKMIVKKLGLVSKARSMVIRNFAKNKPPRAYAGKNPDTAARAQDASSKYNQFVQLNMQLMNELQNSQKELMDALVTINREVETNWQMSVEFRDRVGRLMERIVGK